MDECNKSSLKIPSFAGNMYYKLLRPVHLHNCLRIGTLMVANTLVEHSNVTLGTNMQENIILCNQIPNTSIMQGRAITWALNEGPLMVVRE